MHDISQFLQRHRSGNKWVMVKRVWQWASERTKTSQVFWELPTYPESLAVAPGHNLSRHGWWWCGDDYECDGWWYSRRGATIKNAQDCLIQDADLWRGGWNESQESAKSIRSHNCEHFRRGLSKGGPNIISAELLHDENDWKTHPQKNSEQTSCKSWVVKLSRHQSVKFLQGVKAVSNGRMYIVLRKRGQSQQNCWGL